MPGHFFDLCRTVATPAALSARTEAGVDPGVFLEMGARLFSSFNVGSGVLGVKIWVISDAAGGGGTRASTCILLPAAGDY